jgi:uncharacterized membrane protein YsdA (DUF1294 family)/cold shock CspA family protein
MAEKIKLPSICVGTIVEWRDAQGFGFLELGNARVFLHRREFDEFHKPPEVGDRIRFSIGLDKVGRTCAKSASHLNDGGKLALGDLAILAVLLILPSVALSRVAIPLAFSFGYFGMVSLFGYLVYAADKNRARRSEWRVPEQVLHLVELMGGWPGAFVAQRRLRHKCSKVSYQIVFWVIVLAHELVALDFVLGWVLVRKVAVALSKMF